MIWNEPDRRKFCYCPQTVSLFQQWLQERYQTLDELNKVWSTESPVHYPTWQEVPATGMTAMNARRDWLEFNQFRLYSTMTSYTELVNACDPLKRPTTANLVYHHTAHEDGMHGGNLGLDVGRVGQSMNIMGVSCYTIAHPFDPRPAYETAYKLSRLRSASRDANRRMLVLETEAGPFKRMITDSQRRQRFYHLLAHNAKSILLWNYRSRVSDGQVADFHLQKWDGSPSRRAEAVGEFAGMLQKHATLLNQVYPQREAAILCTEQQQILAYNFYKAEYPQRHDSRFGAYKLLWDLNIPADCLTETNLDEMSQYKLILLPLVENMSAELAEKLRVFVENGGTLIAESPFAFKDENNYLQYRAPSFGLEKVFGAWTSDREGWESALPIHCRAGQAKAHFLWHEFTLCGGEALATYADQAAAVVANKYGKGRAVMAGTEVFRQYAQDPQDAMTALLQEEILASKVRPTASVAGDTANLEVARLSGPGGLLYIVINHNPQEVSANITLADNACWENLETGESVDLSAPISLAAETALALVKTS
jgi:beta-galactosidase GanA